MCGRCARIASAQAAALGALSWERALFEGVGSYLNLGSGSVCCPLRGWRQDRFRMRIRALRIFRIRTLPLSGSVLSNLLFKGLDLSKTWQSQHVAAVPVSPKGFQTSWSRGV